MAEPSVVSERGQQWNKNAHTRLAASAVALMAGRMHRAGYTFAAAITYSYYFYRFVLAAGQVESVLRFDNFVQHVAVHLRTRAACLGYNDVFEGAYLTIETPDEFEEPIPPHLALVRLGKLGRPRVSGGKGIGRKQKRIGSGADITA